MEDLSSDLKVSLFVEPFLLRLLSTTSYFVLYLKCAFFPLFRGKLSTLEGQCHSNGFLSVSVELFSRMWEKEKGKKCQCHSNGPPFASVEQFSPMWEKEKGKRPISLKWTSFCFCWAVLTNVREGKRKKVNATQLDLPLLWLSSSHQCEKRWKEKGQFHSNEPPFASVEQFSPMWEKEKGKKSMSLNWISLCPGWTVLTNVRKGERKNVNVTQLDLHLLRLSGSHQCEKRRKEKGQFLSNGPSSASVEQFSPMWEKEKGKRPISLKWTSLCFGWAVLTNVSKKERKDSLY